MRVRQYALASIPRGGQRHRRESPTRNPEEVPHGFRDRPPSTGYEDGAVRLRSAGDGALLLDLKSMPASISALTLTGDGELLAVGDAQGRVRLWDQNGKRLRAERQDHVGAVRALGFTGQGGASRVSERMGLPSAGKPTGTKRRPRHSLSADRSRPRSSAQTARPRSFWGMSSRHGTR